MKIAKPIVFRNSDFTRASVAYYYDSSGFLNQALVNELRLGYNPATLAFIGPILEGEATNVLTQSNNFAHADWTPSHSGVTIGVTSPFVNPAGESSTQYIDCNASFGRLERANPLPNGTVGTFSIYAKKEIGSLLTLSGSGSGIFNLDNGAIFSANGNETSQYVGHGWWRFSVTGVSTGAPLTISMTTGPFRVRVFGAQLEAGAAVTSYIPTMASAATRAADVENTSPPRVLSSNIPENDAPVWNSGVTYTDKQKVMVLGDVHKIFSSIGSNTNKYPPDNPGSWIDEGATNRWRMFDMTVGSDKQSQSDSPDNTINVLIDLNQPVTSVVLLNVFASSGRIIMRDSEGNIVYDHTEYFLQAPTQSGWWAFYFGPRRRATTLVLTDLPNVIPCTIELILDGGDDIALIGKMIVGDAIDIGCARYGTSVGIIDFSRKERDEFGNNYILERRYISRCDFDIQILTERMSEIYDLLADIRATPALYIGYEGYTVTVLYGFYRDFSIVISGPTRSDCTLQVESI